MAAVQAETEKSMNAAGQLSATGSDALRTADWLRATASDAGTAAEEALYDEDGYLLDGKVLSDADVAFIELHAGVHTGGFTAVRRIQRLFDGLNDDLFLDSLFLCQCHYGIV